jgi:hypothetical protein
MAKKCYLVTKRFFWDTKIRAKNKEDALDKANDRFALETIEGDYDDVDEIKCTKDIK